MKLIVMILLLSQMQFTKKTKYECLPKTLKLFVFLIEINNKIKRDEEINVPIYSNKFFHNLNNFTTECFNKSFDENFIDHCFDSLKRILKPLSKLTGLWEKKDYRSFMMSIKEIVEIFKDSKNICIPSFNNNMIN